MFTLQVNERISLRMMSARDTHALFKITNQSRSYLKKWLPWLESIQSEEDSLEFIKSSLYIYNNRNGITAGVFVQNELVGVVSYNNLDFKNKIGTVGYWLAEDKQGKGIITQSLTALISYGFNELQLNRIEIRVAEKNIPSRNIAERLGFQIEGKIRAAEWLYDHYVDHIVYGMLKSEWYQK